MKVILFGATGMVGQGVLRECLLDPEIESVLSIGRGKTSQLDPKLREVVKADLFDYSSMEADLAGYDACFFCLGISAGGMSEKDYLHVTYDLTTAAAATLVKVNPGMTFIYVSGAGTDSTEHGRAMWARVKGKTENALLQMPFKASYMFRPGLIQPLHGIKSKTKSYRIAYGVLGPVLPLLKSVAPRLVTTTEQVGRAMIKIAKEGAPKRLLENDDINRV